MSKAKSSRTLPSTAYKPGQSGNPGGRPAIDKEVRAAAQEMSVEAIHKLGSIMRNDNVDPRTQAFCANSILDRAVGKPAQALVHSGSIDTSSASVAELTAVFTPDQLRMLSAMDPRIQALTGVKH